MLANKVNWLVKHDYEVTVVTTDQRSRQPYFKMDDAVETIDLGINYDENNGRLLRKILAYPVKQWRHRRRLERVLREKRADIVVCMFNNDVSFVHKIKDGSRKVLEAHFSRNKKLQYGRKGIWAWADRWRSRKEEKLVRCYDRFVVLTEEDRALWDTPLHTPPSTLIPSQILVIPNARTFKPTQKADLHQHRVVAIGRYDYQKGFDTLLYIWSKIIHNAQCIIHNSNGPWTLDIVGDGPQRPELERLVGELGLQDSVRLLKPTDHIEDVYCNASILAMTSRYEGLPMVLLEAQACGLPIVAFACQCGPRDIITDGVDGYLIENRDEACFAQKLLQLMQDEPLRQQMGAHAVAASLRYTEENIMSQWDKLFKGI